MLRNNVLISLGRLFLFCLHHVSRPTSLVKDMMDVARKAIHYLHNLEWSERQQQHCVFCHREELTTVLYEASPSRPAICHLPSAHVPVC